MAAGRTRSRGRLSLTCPASRLPGRISDGKRSIPAGIGCRKAGGARRRGTRSCTPISRSGIRRRAVLPMTPTTTGTGTWARGSRRTPNPAWCPTPCARRLARRIRRLARRRRRRLPRRRPRLRLRRTAQPGRRTPSPPGSPAVAKAAWAGENRRPRRLIPVSRRGSTPTLGPLALTARLATGPPITALAARSTPPTSVRGQQASIRRLSAIRSGMRNHRQLSTTAAAAVGAEPTAAGDLRRLRSPGSRTASSRRPARQRSRGRCRRPAGRPPPRHRRGHGGRRLRSLPPRRLLWLQGLPPGCLLRCLPPRFLLRLRDLWAGCLPRLQFQFQFQFLLRASGQSPGQQPADHQQARKRQNALAARRVARQRGPAVQGNRASASPGGSPP